MHLASDYIHPTPRGGRCRIRFYLPEEERDVPVVICSELPSNEGSSVTYSAHQIAAEVIRYHRLGVSPVWVEHYPKEAPDGHSETFELVVFSSYEVRTPELACVVEMERAQAKFGASEAITPYALRATILFRPEDGTWKVAHRHADPISTVQPAASYEVE